jgi:hypothetical protein
LTKSGCPWLGGIKKQTKERIMVTNKSLAKFFTVLIFLGTLGPAWGDNDFGIRGLKFKGQKLATACQMVKDADIGWYRGSVLWKKIVDNEANYDWQGLDKQLKKVVRRRIQTIITLRSVHKKFAPGSEKVDLGYKSHWKSAPPAPMYLDLYRDFVRNTVERYDGDGVLDADFITDRKNIRYWQIENEPGKKPHTGSSFWKGNAAEYAELYMIAYDAIKEADPEAKVALAGFTWNAMKYYMEHSISFPSEVLRILSENDGDFDIFDYHFYEDYKKFRKIEGIIESNLAVDAAFVEKQVWITETNVNKKTLDPDYTQEAYNRFVAKDIVKRYSTMLHNDVQKAFWFKFCDETDAIWQIPMDPNDYYKFRGLVENDFTEKPVYYTYKLLIQKTKGKARVKKFSTDLSFVRIYIFGRNDNAVYTMWYDPPDGGSTEISVSLPWDQVLITHVITEPGVTDPETEIRPTENGVLQIMLDDSPIFLEKY